MITVRNVTAADAEAWLQLRRPLWPKVSVTEVGLVRCFRKDL